jgi:hypothetical protein
VFLPRRTAKASLHLFVPRFERVRGFLVNAGRRERVKFAPGKKKNPGAMAGVSDSERVAFYQR